MRSDGSGLRTEARGGGPGFRTQARSDISEFKIEVRADLSELRREVGRLRSDLIKWRSPWEPPGKLTETEPHLHSLRATLRLWNGGTLP